MECSRRPSRAATANALVATNASVRPLAPLDSVHAPLVRENRPEQLVVIFTVPEERAPKNAFGVRADLSQRAVAASVRDRGARFEPVNTHSIDGEVHNRCRRIDKSACTPKGGADRKAPFCEAEIRVERAQLNDADGSGQTCGHDAEADEPPGGTFLMRPGDERFKSIERCRRR